MLKDLIKHTATELGTTQVQAKSILGIVLSAAERQGSEFTAQLFKRLPGARTLSARTSDDTGVACDMISRLIEQTPGGRRHVVSDMIRNLQKEGLGHEQIGKLLPAIADFAETRYDISGGHLGDMLGSMIAVQSSGIAAAA